MGVAGREFVCLLPLKKETLERVGERTDTTQHTEALKGGQRVVGRFWRPLAGNLWGISGVGCGEAGGRSGEAGGSGGERGRGSRQSLGVWRDSGGLAARRTFSVNDAGGWRCCEDGVV